MFAELNKMGKKWGLWEKTAEDEWIEAELALLEQQGREMEHESAAIKVMVKGKGWKLLEKQMDAQIDLLHLKLEDMDDADARAKIKVFRWMKNYVRSHLENSAM